jgi:hypothetical protein
MPMGSTDHFASVYWKEAIWVEVEEEAEDARTRSATGYDADLGEPEQRVPANHPIRMIKQLAEVALEELSPLFEQTYSEVGRPSIPPERLLKASLLMAL